MYSINKTDYGFKLVFEGRIDEHVIHRCVNESKRLLAEVKGEFCLLVDMRSLKPFHPQVQKIFEKGQRLYKEKGAKRIAVIVSDSNIMAQMQHFSINSETFVGRRYINATKTKNWEYSALEWILKEIEPEESKDDKYD